ncbi:integrin beta-2-like [Epargyreus clarus]|uniref:integrin beta-2-like n=1 Tax=Epargyreus clarus TaxID=520877 RepID=UPI003C30B881
MKSLTLTVIFIYFSVGVISAKHSVISLDENVVCRIKKSCLDCLRLPQCSWCPTESRCYSIKLITEQGYCENATIHHIDYGMSLKENAECSCAGGNMERNCIPPGLPQEEECCGRGKCICGRCFCDTNPDPENPTKVVTGEYCELDNFSCDDPKCNEGPYSIYDMKILEDENSLITMESKVAQPLEE